MAKNLLLLVIFGITSSFEFNGNFLPSFVTYDDRSTYKSKRDKTLDCSCGEIRNHDPTQPFPWEVLITHRNIIDPLKAGNSTNDTESIDSHKYCSGTIINSNTILTSVSCLLNQRLTDILGNATKGIVFPDKCVHQPNELQVRRLAHMNETLNVSDFFYEKKFLSHAGIYSKVDYDLALLTLNVSLKFGSSTGIVPICLPNKQFKDEELEGLEATYSLSAPESSLNGSNVSKIIRNFHSSHIYSRDRCRVNALTKWISDRFICTEADKFSVKLFTEIGTALAIHDSDVYTQLGIVSWKTYLPLIAERKPLTLSTNVGNFLEEIESYSQKKNAKWCRNGWNGLPRKKWLNAAPNSINLPSVSRFKPWRGISSHFRNIRSDCVCGKVNSLTSMGRIQGGQDAKPYEFGWMVQLFFKHRNTSAICGASVINSRIVLTAAHCAHGEPSGFGLAEEDKIVPRNMHVRIQRYNGPLDRDDNSRELKVEAIIIYPYYDPGRITEDVAIIVLQESINFQKLRGKVSPICLPKTGEILEMDGRKDAKIIGWGRTEALKKGSHAHKLQELQVTVVSRADCVSILNEYREKKKGNYLYLMGPPEKSPAWKICAGTFSVPQNYNDPAQGDSGGPLFLPITSGSKTHIQIGIASALTMRPDPDFLATNLRTVAFYERTERFIEFIDYYSLITDAYWCTRGIKKA